MTSVTQRISKIKQPRGGYLKPKDFVEIIMDDGVELNPEENIHGSLIGAAVEYITRYTMGLLRNKHSKSHCLVHRS